MTKNIFSFIVERIYCGQASKRFVKCLLAEFILFMFLKHDSPNDHSKIISFFATIFHLQDGEVSRIMTLEFHREASYMNRDEITLY